MGVTSPRLKGINEYLTYRGSSWHNKDPIVLEPEAIVEAAGRVCYQSWENLGNKTRAEYIGNMIEHGHGSTLEHTWFNLMCADVPRSTQLEIVRHGEGTAFSWESTRFTNKHMRFVVPPRLRDDHEARQAFEIACRNLATTYYFLESRAKREADVGTLKRKRALEAARAILPNSLGSDGMVSMNARAARHILQLRTDEHADLSIREWAYAAYEALKPWLPSIFADANEETAVEGVSRIAFTHSKV